MFSDAQHQTLQAAIEKTGAQTDSIEVRQVLALVDARVAPKEQPRAVQELLGDQEKKKKGNVQVVVGYRWRKGYGELTGAELEAYGEGPDSGVRPFRPLDPLEALETASATTTGTAGHRLESVRARLAAPAHTVEARVERIEGTVEELLGAVEKINDTLRRYRDTFNQHVEILNVAQEGIGNLQYNVGILHEDIKGLYGA